MLNPRTLRGSLTIAYASALIVAMVVFAALALAVIDRSQRAAIDAQLATTARALIAVLDTSHGRIVTDDIDRSQFDAVLGIRAASAIFGREGIVRLSSTSVVPAEIRTLAAEAQDKEYRTVVAHGDSLRVFAAPVANVNGPVGSIAVWLDSDAVDDLDRRVALAFAFAIPVIAALAVLVSSAIARRALLPLDRIASLASEIEAHDLSRRLALEQRDDELGRLATTFDRMLDRIEQAFERERRFTGDASHELRAPLSVILAEADLALRKDRSPDEYRRALATIADEAEALEALTRDLLAAARAEGPADTKRVPVDVGAVAERVVERLAVLAQAREITISTTIADGTFVSADAEALERALVTVVQNAIKYAPQGGHVEVVVSRDGDRVELRISDDGAGFSADALQHAFERFWRDDAARSQPGTGLGLAIARATVERYGGTIAISNAPHGAIVKMRFAAQPPGGASS